MRLITLLVSILAFAFGTQGLSLAPKVYDGEVYIHLMPWFETKDSSGDGKWGIHWTMANMNPDIIDGSGKRQIAAHYYPDIELYDSGDESVIEYQLNLMKYAGVAGVFIDWPGTLNVWDYPGNFANSEAIIRVCDRLGMKFAIVYEDHNIKMAYEAGLIPDKIAAAQADMRYLNNNYFGKGNYLTIDGYPVLLDFGPQTFQEESEWTQIFSVLPLPRAPKFFTLWGESFEAGRHAAGEYCWIWVDFLQGLRNFYDFNTSPIKIGGAYPGFNSFYSIGGWPGDPGWQIPVNADTFTQTLDLALAANVPFIQLNTWNDYGEGTMIEPTREFGNQFLTILQQKLGVIYTERELNLVKDLYMKRKEFGNDSSKTDALQRAAEALNNLKPDEAELILRSL